MNKIANAWKKIPKWTWFGFPLLLLLGLISYVIVIPYQNWTSYTVDNFITFNYPSTWHVQQSNFKELSGTEDLFLISNYSGQLSTQSLSSPDERYLIDGYRISRERVNTIDEYSSFLNERCSNNNCDLKIFKSQKNGFNILETVLTNEKGSDKFGSDPFYGGESYVFVEGDKYIYMIHMGFISGPSAFTDFFRQKLIDKISSTIQVNPK